MKKAISLTTTDNESLTILSTDILVAEAYGGNYKIVYRDSDSNVKSAIVTNTLADIQSQSHCLFEFDGIYLSTHHVEFVAGNASGAVLSYNNKKFTTSDSKTIVIDSINAITDRVTNDLAINVKAYGAVGDGITDDTNAITEAITDANISGGTILFPGGTYLITSLITTSLAGVKLIGVPGETTITGSFGYGLIKFTTMTDCEIYGITFQNTYVNSVEDAAASIVYQTGGNVSNVKISHCTFTCPNANTSGLTFYTNTAAGGTATINDLEISHNTFTSIGRIACTIMQRNSSNPALAQKIKFNNNKGEDLGTQGTYGFLLSLDGKGQAFQVNWNTVSEALGIGIESGFDRGEFIGNTFLGFTKSYKPFSISKGVGEEVIISNISMSANRTIGASQLASTLYDITNSTFEGNYFESSQASSAGVLFRDLTNCLFVNEHYKGLSYGLYIESSTGCSENSFTNCRFSTSGSGTNFSVVRFYGALTTKNYVSHCRLYKGTGGVYLDESSSATGNFAYNNTYDGSPVEYSGGRGSSLVAKTAAYTCLTTDATVTANASGGAFAVTLPGSGSTTKGRIITIKKIDSSVNAVTVGTQSAQTIDGAASYSLASQWKYVTVQSDGSNWIIIGNN